MVNERKRKREYKMLKEKLNVEKKIEKFKNLDDDEIWEFNLLTKESTCELKTLF